MEGNTELIATSFGLLVVPFLVYGTIWLMGRFAVSDGDRGRRERTVPSRNSGPRRVIPGTRSEESD